MVKNVKGKWKQMGTGRRALGRQGEFWLLGWVRSRPCKIPCVGVYGRQPDVPLYVSPLFKSMHGFWVVKVKSDGFLQCDCVPPFHHHMLLARSSDFNSKYRIAFTTSVKLRLRANSYAVMGCLTKLSPSLAKGFAPAWSSIKAASTLLLHTAVYKAVEPNLPPGAPNRRQARASGGSRGWTPC